jgi:uncharacterized protein YodC (DUF2158 family)
MTEPLNAAVPFKPGDVVELKSGGPAMTVLAVKEDGVHCLWYAEMSDEVKTTVIPALCLELSENEDEDDEDEDEDEDEDDDD